MLENKNYLPLLSSVLFSAVSQFHFPFLL